jgi:hypothetical protein
LSINFNFDANSTQITDASHKYLYAVIIISLSVLLIMRKIFRQICSGSQDTNFVFSNPPQIVLFVRYVERYGRARQAIDVNMAHAHCVLDN